MTDCRRGLFSMAHIATAAAACLAISMAPSVAQAALSYVATVNGHNEFTIGNGGTQVEYNVQPDTDYNWYYEDGSLVTYTKNGVTANRDGMKTFAATNAAFGTAIGDLKLQFDYATSSLTNTDGYAYGNYPTVNVFITDGSGNYAIWSATSGGTGFTTADVTDRTGWATFTLDCTSFADTSTFGKINESTNESVLANGNLYDTVEWSAIKGWTIAGFYTEQFAPTGDWEAWGENLWSDINEAGDIIPVNEFGIALVWGDTVGSMLGDYDNTYVGVLAERAYGKTVKAIDNLVVTVRNENGDAEDTYDISFAADEVPGSAVPEPGSMLVWAMGSVCGLFAVRRRRRQS